MKLFEGDCNDCRHLLNIKFNLKKKPERGSYFHLKQCIFFSIHRRGFFGGFQDPNPKRKPKSHIFPQRLRKREKLLGFPHPKKTRSKDLVGQSRELKLLQQVLMKFSFQNSNLCH